MLEYGQQASSPYLRWDIALMERIQRLATSMVKGMRELPYEDRLRRINIFSLERRRLCWDLILAYNIFHGRKMEQFGDRVKLWIVAFVKCGHSRTEYETCLSHLSLLTLAHTFQSKRGVTRNPVYLFRTLRMCCQSLSERAKVVERAMLFGWVKQHDSVIHKNVKQKLHTDRSRDDSKSPCIYRFASGDLWMNGFDDIPHSDIGETVYSRRHRAECLNKNQ